MTNEELHSKADSLMREIMQTREDWREELQERRIPPPRPGKYDGELSGAVPVSDLERNHA